MPDAKIAAGGVDVSWEVDLSGRLRAGAAAAAADALAAEHGVRGVRLLVMTDVATNYFTLVGALRQLDTLRAISAAQDETLRLVQARHRAGLATPFDVERAQTDAESRARAQIPPLETIAAVSRHRIAVLIGDQAFNAAAIVPWRGDLAVPATPAGQPAALLQRRPDVLAADGPARRGQCAPPAGRGRMVPAPLSRRVVRPPERGAERRGPGRRPLHQRGGAARDADLQRRPHEQAINEIAESGQREALLRAEDGMVRALEDVENALVALHQERQRAQSLQAAATSAEAALGRAQSLYDRGQIDLLPLLDAQRARLAVRLCANDSSTAAAARQRAALQGAGRRLAGVRSHRPSPRTPARARPFLKPSAQTRNSLENHSCRGRRSCAHCRHAQRLQPRQAARRGAPAGAHGRNPL